MSWAERDIANLERQHDPFRCQWPNVPRAQVIEDTSVAPEFYARDERDLIAEETAADQKLQARFDEGETSE